MEERVRRLKGNTEMTRQETVTLRFDEGGK